jgi:hypothetical protein
MRPERVHPVKSVRSLLFPVAAARRRDVFFFFNHRTIHSQFLINPGAANSFSLSHVTRPMANEIINTLIRCPHSRGHVGIHLPVASRNNGSESLRFVFFFFHCDGVISSPCDYFYMLSAWQGCIIYQHCVNEEIVFRSAYVSLINSCRCCYCATTVVSYRIVDNCPILSLVLRKTNQKRRNCCCYYTRPSIVIIIVIVTANTPPAPSVSDGTEARVGDDSVI